MRIVFGRKTFWVLAALAAPAFASAAPTTNPVEESRPAAQAALDQLNKGNVPVRGKEVAEDAAKAGAKKSKHLLSLDGGVDFTTAYFFRGYREQDKGLIVQPYATLTLNLPQWQDIGGSGLSINPYVGTWNSIHSSTSRHSSSSLASWYETDMIAGVNVSKGPLSLGLLYTYYDSPSGSFTTAQEVGATLSLDDSDLHLLPLALNPKVGLYRELDRSANIDHQGPGTYLEVGVEPSTKVNVGSLPVTLSAPVTFGLGFDRYYGNETLGYGAFGVKASIPLPISDKFGEWKLTVGATYLHDFADTAKASNFGHADKLIGTVGVGFSF